MAKKIISCVVLLFFLWFDICCTIHGTKWITVDQAKGKNEPILAVVKKTGERFDFLKEKPGEILNEDVIGEHFMTNKDIIDVADIKKKEIDTQNQSMVITKYDGKVISLANVREIGGKIYRMVEGSIPLSEIKILRVKGVDVGVSILATAYLICVFVGILAVVLFPELREVPHGLYRHSATRLN